MRKGPVAAFFLALLLSSPLLRAELAVFTDGRVLRVEDAELVGDMIRLELIGGGILEVSALRIDRVVDDEIDHSDQGEKLRVGSCPCSYAKVSLGEDVPFADLIQAAAKEADIHPKLLASLVRAESNFDPMAISRVGARGLTQLMPSTAAEMGVLHAFDPAENLRGGARYLRMLLDRFDSLELALAAYNAGAATVEKYGGVPPYRETHSYLNRILGNFCPGKEAFRPTSP